MCGKRFGVRWSVLLLVLLLSGFGPLVLAQEVVQVPRETWQKILMEIDNLDRIVNQLKQDATKLQEELQNERKIRIEQIELFKMELTREQKRSSDLENSRNQWSQTAKNRLIVIGILSLLGGIGWLL